MPLAEVLVGSVAAELTAKVLLHPLDTLKTRLQYLVLPKRSVSTASSLPLVADIKLGLRILAASTRSPYNSMVEPDQRMVRGSYAAERLKAALVSLYRGIGVQLVGVLPIALVYMPTYEFTKQRVRGTVLESTPFAGVVTGVASAVARVPISVIKSRMQLGLHKSTEAAFRSVVTKRGVDGLFVGFRATARALAHTHTYTAIISTHARHPAAADHRFGSSDFCSCPFITGRLHWTCGTPRCSSQLSRTCACSQCVCRLSSGATHCSSAPARMLRLASALGSSLQ